MSTYASVLSVNGAHSDIILAQTSPIYMNLILHNISNTPFAMYISVCMFIL